MPSIQKTLLVRYVDDKASFDNLNSFSTFDEIVNQELTPELNFESVGFNEPLYILFSSGTTGIPKCIVHGVGGTLIQHKKEHTLHCNITSGERSLLLFNMWLDDVELACQ